VKWIRNTPTPTRQWHDLKIRIAGTKVSGKIGLWSKADSHLYFDDFTVTRLTEARTRAARAAAAEPMRAGLHFCTVSSPPRPAQRTIVSDS